MTSGSRYRGTIRLPADQAWKVGNASMRGIVFPRLYKRRETEEFDSDPESPVPILLDEAYSFDHFFHWCYGVAIVDDPRDFFPDPTCCSRGQLVEHQSALIAHENGYQPMRPRDYPNFVNPWGVGINLVRKDEP